MISSLAVIGSSFGDEGKGLVTDYLTRLKIDSSHNPIVIRYSGGHNAGHTVYNEKHKHIFATFGSGTLSGAPSYLSKFCTMDPSALLLERDVLKSNGYDPIIYIDKETMVTTPYDIADNRKKEEENNHGSVGVGLGSTNQRESNFYHLHFIDILYEKILIEKLWNIGNYYQNVKNQKTLKVVLGDFLNDCKKIRDELLGNSIIMTTGLPIDFDSYIFEGSQGLLLDQHYGFFPNVTRTNTGTKNILKLLPQGSNLDIFLVTRAYQTRHGNGFMTNEKIPHNIKKNPEETNVTNQYQGEFRRALLDVDLLEYAFQKDSLLSRGNFGVGKNLVITCLDHLEEFKYTYKDKIVECENKDDFVRSVYMNLCKYVYHVFYSDSPYSSLKKLE